MAKVERGCPKCGLVFTSDRADAPCPACLLATTFDTPDVDPGPAFWEDAPPAEDVANKRTFSHFEILDELGRGGMGVVYRARDLNTERIVALKVLQAHHLTVPDLVMRFRAEVRAVSSLDHPHVLPIHEVGECEGVPFFSMKLTTGGSLAQNIGTYLGRPREAAQLLAKVARGVQHAHERGILHRDLKPGNILLDAAGEPYVCDFGLAKWLEDDRKLTVTAAVLGTPHYIAPEQAMGTKALTTAVDIYSLGAILYELVTGRPPFVGGTVLETLVASQDKSPERPSSIAKNVPRDLETICLKALRHEPELRYASARAMADDLECFSTGRPISARQVKAGEQLWRWAKRNPLPASLLVLLLLLAIGVAAVSTLAAIRIDREKQRALEAETLAIKEKARAENQLYESLLAQARAWRLSGEAGQRYKAMDAVERAAAIKTSFELRNEAIAALALPDLRLERRLPIRKSVAKQPLRYSTDLLSAAVVTENGELAQIDLATGNAVHLVKTAGDRAEELYYSGDGYVAARLESGAVIVADFRQEKELFRLPTNTAQKARNRMFPAALSFSASGLRLAVPHISGEMAIHEVQTGRVVTHFSISYVPEVVSLSPDDNRVAIYSSQFGLQIWRLSPSPTLIGQVPLPRVLSIDWHDDTLAAGASDYKVYIVDAGRAELLYSLAGHKQDVTHVRFHPTGDFLATTSRDQTVKIWDLLNREVAVTISGFGSEASLTFSRAGNLLATTDYSGDAVTLRFEDGTNVVKGVAAPRAGDFSSLVSSLDFSPSSELVVTTRYGGGFSVYSSRTLHRLFDVNDPTMGETTAQFVGDKKIVVASRNTSPAIYEINADKSQVSRLGLGIDSGFILGSATSGVGPIALTNSASGEVVFLDRTNFSTLRREKTSAELWDAVADSNLRWIAAGFSNSGPDITAILSNGQPRVLRSGVGATLAVSSDYRHLITTGSNGLQIWETQSWEPVTNLPPQIDLRQVSCAAYSPDGRFLAFNLSSTIWLLNAVDHEPIAALYTNTITNQEYRVRFDSTSQLLALQGQDNSLKIWKLQPLFQMLDRMKLFSNSPSNKNQ